MRIFGRKTWEPRPFGDWPFAVPTTELRIHSSDIDSLDMWPKNAPNRKIRHRFELLETALQTSAQGDTVIHCPDFIAHLHNERSKAPFQLIAISFPEGYKKPKPIKVFLVGRKGNIPTELERKFAKLFRSFK
jgi:hypothetical protein